MSVSKPFVPGCSTSFQKFLLGTWQVHRSLQYRTGGYTGQFTGHARVKPVDSGAPPGTLLYREEGQFISCDGSKRMSTHREYAFCCGTWPVTVRFVERPDPLELGSHFVTLGCPADGAECSFVHQCAPDVYSGAWRFVSEDAFTWSWHIKGPSKDGEISTRYVRQL